MKERTYEERVALGNWAEDLIKHPNFVGVCNGIVAESLAGMLSAEPGSDKAKQLHMEMLSADRFKNALQSLVNDAHMAKKQAAVRS